MNQPNPQNPNRPPQQGPQLKCTPENLIVLLSGDEKSNPKLRAIAEKRFPGAQVVERVPVARLTNLHGVVAAINVVEVDYDEEGRQKVDASKTRFTEPLYVADHWHQGIGGDWMVHTPTFCSELGKRIVPKQINSRAISEGFIKLGDV